MKLARYLYKNQISFGQVINNEIYDLSDESDNIISFLQKNHTYNVDYKKKKEIIKIEDVKILAPFSKINSLRDAYAFREHVETCRKNRGAEMIKEFDEFPVFYFSNHNSILGHLDEIECMPEHLNKLDYELEIAIVICKEGKNIKAEKAREFIGGFTIYNDISARDIQSSEMKLNLGPAKGKDFANIFGPFVVTRDEIYENEISNGKIDLEMKCKINNKLYSIGNLKTMHWSFEEIIERVSYGTKIFPGDVIGSGTVGKGCLLEINGTEKRKNIEYKETWLKENDIIEMSIEKIGTLTNKIVLHK